MKSIFKYETIVRGSARRLVIQIQIQILSAKKASIVYLPAVKT